MLQKIGLIAALAACFVVAGCERQPPLAHALSAFRAGDFPEFVKAQQEAAEALKTAIQPGGDLCRVSAADIAKYGDVHMIEELNRPALFQGSEDERLVYALSVAGIAPHILPGSFLERAPIARIEEHDMSCGDQGQAMTALTEGGPYMQADNETRMTVLNNWIKDLKAKYGADFEARMQAAGGRLSFHGYDGSWPPKVDFGEYYEIPTFHKVGNPTDDTFHRVGDEAK